MRSSRFAAKIISTGKARTIQYGELQKKKGGSTGWMRATVQQAFSRGLRDAAKGLHKNTYKDIACSNAYAEGYAAGRKYGGSA